MSITREKETGDWLVSARAAVATLAAMITILTALVGASAWCIGLYTGLSTRVTVLESNDQYMRDDLKEIKGMLSELLMGNDSVRRNLKE